MDTAPTDHNKALELRYMPGVCPTGWGPAVPKEVLTPLKNSWLPISHLPSLGIYKVNHFPSGRLGGAYHHKRTVHTILSP